MIIIFENGRLGNQLFQYAALKDLFPNQQLVFFGCEDLRIVLSSFDSKIISCKKLPSVFILPISYLFGLISSLKIIGRIREVKADSIYKIEKRRGILLNLYLLDSSFFQHQDVIKKINPDFHLRQELIIEAKKWLDDQDIFPTPCELVFVHIRRCDYLIWPSREYPAVLDFSWYELMMNKVRERVDNPLFLILTDDIFYARDLLDQRKDVLISNNSLYVDLALMSLCKHGILSASSFAWWGAWFSRHSNVSHGSLKYDRIYIAPKFWAGHRQEKWHPPNFISDWIEYH